MAAAAPSRVPDTRPLVARYQHLLPPGRSSAAGLLVLLVAWLTIYTIEEGHVGIVKRFGKAISQVDPGIHLKIPFVDGIEKMEVRQRKNVEELAARSIVWSPGRCFRSWLNMEFPAGPGWYRYP